MPKITTLLFDCDNTLVLSEHVAFEACADFANEILARANIDARYTGPQLMQEFVGQNFRGMMTSLMQIHSFTIPQDIFEEYVKEEETRVIAKIQEKGEPCNGANEALEKVYNSKRYNMAVVSSSALRRVKASVEKVGQDKYLPTDKIYSAATSMPVPTSKPDPAIYLFACEQLGVNPENCIAVEDSKSGATSAARAGIHVMGYVGCYETDEKRKEVEAVLRAVGAKVIMQEWSDFEKCLQELEGLATGRDSPSKL